MPCYFPLEGFQRSAGAPLSFGAAGYRPGVRRVMVGCGQCHGCRLAKSAEWAVRCMHEAQMHESSCFVTLTYEESPVTLVPRDLQLFFKRLRHFYNVRYLACGEYGDKFGRPHYHACLFGVKFEDERPWRKSTSGFELRRSSILELLWGHGNCEIGDLSFESAAYVARYAMKKQMGKDAGKKREIFDVETGEIVEREHEFLRMSRVPAIASKWLEKYSGDVYPQGVVVMRGGVKCKPPRFYDKRYRAEVGDDVYSELVARRLRAADEHFDDNSPRRLRVKEIVAEARLMLKEKSL